MPNVYYCLGRMARREASYGGFTEPVCDMLCFDHHHMETYQFPSSLFPDVM